MVVLVIFFGRSHFVTLLRVCGTSSHNAVYWEEKDKFKDLLG